MHDMTKIVRELEREGWEVKHTKGGHIRLAPPDGGALIFASSTPSDRRAVAKLRSQVKRARQRKGPPPRDTNVTRQRP